MPLYYLFMHVWILLVGSDEFILRVPSLILHCCATVIVHIYLEEKYWKSGWWLWLLTAGYLFFPPLLYFALSAHVYSMFVFITILSIYALLTDRKRLYIFSNILGLYTSYLFLLVLAVSHVYRKRSRRSSLLGLFILAYIPWIVFAVPRLDTPMSFPLMGRSSDLRMAFAQAKGLSDCREKIFVSDPSLIYVAKYYNRGVPVSVYTAPPIYPNRACVVNSRGGVEIRSIQ